MSNGGGISNNGEEGFANLDLENCILSGNSASGSGAGIYNNGSANGGGAGGEAILSLSDCTLADNSAQNNGGGIHNDGSFLGKAVLSLSLNNSILAGNSASTGPDLSLSNATGNNLLSSFDGYTVDTGADKNHSRPGPSSRSAW